MVHTRETRASACEIKFVVDPAVAARIREWARIHLVADPHGGGPFHDEYDTSSLYFDTRRLDVFHRRGSYGRAKYRVRRYGEADTVFLERKLRKPGLLIKRRTLEPLESLCRLDAPPAGAWGGEWFLRRLEARRLSPVCQVSYQRIARTADSPEGPARFTLDSGLRVLPLTTPAFSREPGVPFFEERVILELKFRTQLPAVFRRLVEDFVLQTQTASKYRLGMTALGNVALGVPALAVPGSDVSYA
jgi:hypothetical protein